MQKVWKICCMSFETGTVPENQKDAVILLTSEGDKGKCKSYKEISLLSVVGEAYNKTLIDRVRKIDSGMNDNQQSCFRLGRGCVD